MTEQERKLWFEFLREYPVRFRRQEIIGNSIADFYCDRARLAIELDGSQHSSPEARQKDAKRTRAIEKLGIRVLRFGNRDVQEHFEGVCAAIDAAVKTRLPTPQSAPLAGEP